MHVFFIIIRKSSKIIQIKKTKYYCQIKAYRLSCNSFFTYDLKADFQLPLNNRFDYNSVLLSEVYVHGNKKIDLTLFQDYTS